MDAYKGKQNLGFMCEVPKHLSDGQVAFSRTSWIIKFIKKKYIQTQHFTIHVKYPQLAPPLPILITGTRIYSALYLLYIQISPCT